VAIQVALNTSSSAPGPAAEIVSDEVARAISARTPRMLIVVVHVHVVPGGSEAFERATLENARASSSEPGIARFDVIRQQDDPQRYLLVEVYRSADAPAAHKETAHYQKWRDAVAPLMASPRTSHKYENVAPSDAGWETPGAR
jgi:quinol monooxygenase YgiN